jgi:hypothetical protein
LSWYSASLGHLFRQYIAGLYVRTIQSFTNPAEMGQPLNPRQQTCVGLDDMSVSSQAAMHALNVRLSSTDIALAMIVSFSSIA